MVEIMIPTPATALLKEIGRFIGIEALDFNNDGLCLLQLQEKHPLIVRHDKEADRIVILVEVSTLEEISSDLFAKILGFNFIRTATPGPWIALEEKSNILFLADEYPLEAAHSEKLRDRLALFFEQYLAFQRLCSSEVIETMLEEKEQA